MREPSNYIGKPIQSLQTMLRSISKIDPNVLPVIPNGLYGSSTFASVRSFQNAHGLSPTGVTDLQTWRSITDTYTRAAPQLKEPALTIPWPIGFSVLPGERNRHIYLVQAMLHALSEYFPDLPAPAMTGILDLPTQQGLIRIQTAAELPATGTLDRPTWHYLTRLYEIAFRSKKE